MIQKNGFQQFGTGTPDTDYVWGTWEEREHTFLSAASSFPPVLLVEASPGGVQSFLEPALREEGYTLRLASSLDQALALVSIQTFDLVLVDVSADTPNQLFTSLKPLKARIQPLKLGVITNVAVSAEEADAQGFAFVLPRPVAVEQLLAKTAISIHKALTPEQQRQALVVKRFFEALKLKQRSALAHLCTEDMVFYPPVPYSSRLAQALSGRTTISGSVEAQRNQYKGIRLEIHHIYSRPRGLVAQYHLWWAETDGKWDEEVGALLVQFTGDRIRQIGLRAGTH